MGAPEALLLAGVSAIIVGALSAVVSRSPRAGLTVQSIGMVLLGAAGVWVLASGHTVGAGFRSEVRPAFGVDGLSGFFLLIIAVVGAPATLFARDALEADWQGRSLALATGAFLLALVGFVCARDVSTFLGFWELMTLRAGGRDPAGSAGSRRRVTACSRIWRSRTSVAPVCGSSMLVLAQHGALGDRGAAGQAAADGGRGLRGAGRVRDEGGVDAVAFVAAAGASARAGAYVGADVGRDDQARALRADPGAVRVARRAPPVGRDHAARGWCACRALGGVLYALVQHELKRLLAFHSIENVGIIALGLGASLVFADVGGADMWARSRSRRRCCTRSTTRSSRRCCSSARERSSEAVGSLSSTGSAGLLRRMPWTGGAFAVGAMAIAGLPPLNGFASEWLTLAVAAARRRVAGRVGVALAGAVAPPRWPATAALAVFCFVKVIGLVLLGSPRRAGVRGRDARRRWRCGRAWSSSPGRAWCWACVPGLLVPTLAASGAGRAVRLSRGRGPVMCRAPGRCRRSGLRSRSWCCVRAVGVAGPRPAVRRRVRRGRAASGRAGACVDVGGVHQAAAARAGGVLRPRREVRVTPRAGVVAGGRVRGGGTAPVRHAALRAG